MLKWLWLGASVFWMFTSAVYLFAGDLEKGLTRLALFIACSTAFSLEVHKYITGGK